MKDQNLLRRKLNQNATTYAMALASKYLYVTLSKVSLMIFCNFFQLYNRLEKFYKYKFIKYIKQKIFNSKSCKAYNYISLHLRKVSGVSISERTCTFLVYQVIFNNINSSNTTKLKEIWFNYSKVHIKKQTKTKALIEWIYCLYN